MMGSLFSRFSQNIPAVNLETCADDNKISRGSYCLTILPKPTGQSTWQLAPVMTEFHDGVAFLAILQKPAGYIVKGGVDGK
jgi:hypothetical protein